MSALVDETGDLKRGTETVGVQRQCTGTAGRVENSQVAVYLAYASDAGHALIDRRLCLPQAWVTGPARRTRARVPDEIEFATKPTLAAELDQKQWQRLSAGNGTKGTGWYSSAQIAIGDHPAAGGTCSILIRRNDQTGEQAYYRCFAPGAHTLTDLVRVAGKRWTVEESFQTSKGLTGLDQDQVRIWTSWHRWTALVILAFAFRATVTARERTQHQDQSLIRLSINEFRCLFFALILPPLQHHTGIAVWSHRRRQHQKRAQISHKNHRSKR